MEKPIYFDYAATTPVDPRVIAEMSNCLGLDGEFGNPASNTHQYGWQAEELVEHARRQVASLVNANPREIVWTSGATEADNLAIKGIAHAHRNRGNHIITSKTEHKAVLDTCKVLEKAGFTVTYLKPDASGIISLDSIKDAVTEQTILLSIMHVNNETGVAQDIAAIGDFAKQRGIYFHVDAAQSVGKLPIDLASLSVDLMSFSGHKLYGPKGIGALFVRRKPKVRIEAEMHGGGHEQGMRSGTLATHQIVGMGQAYEIARLEMTSESARIVEMRDRLQAELLALGGVTLNGSEEHRSPNILNLAFAGVEGEALLMALTGIAVSTGSACNSTSMESSHVLSAMGCEQGLAHSSLRFSLGRFTTNADIDFAISHVQQHVVRLREMSPLWEKSKV